MSWMVTPWLATRVRVALLQSQGVPAVLSLVRLGLGGAWVLGVRVGDMFEQREAGVVRRWRLAGNVCVPLDQTEPR